MQYKFRDNRAEHCTSSDNDYTYTTQTESKQSTSLCWLYQYHSIPRRKQPISKLH